MDISSRVKEVRKQKRLSQAAFGQQLGVSRDVINNIENNRVELSEIMLKALCAEFAVNETWLRTGNGSAFVEDDNALLSQLAKQYRLDDLSKTILSAYANLDVSKRAAFNAFVREISACIMEQSKENARIEINKIIASSRASDTVKKDLHGKVNMVITDCFPHIGFGNVSEFEISEEISDEQNSADLHAMLDDQITKEKRQASKASSAKESDVG